jgi:hypothetical protein
MEQSRRDFDELMKRESSNLIQFYQDKFEQEINRCEECSSKEDYVGTFYHYDFAHSINQYLKALESVHAK